MASLKQRLIKATNLLSQFFDLPTTDSVTTQLALANLTGNTGIHVKNPNDIRFPNKLELDLNNILINTADGAPLTKTLIDRINLFNVPGAINNLPEGTKDNSVNDLVQIYFNEDDFLKDTTKDSRPSINTILGSAVGQNSTINSNSSDPKKEYPNLSIILSNSMRVSLEQRNVDAVSIFLNGIPNLELARSVPFVNIQFFFPRPPTDSNRTIQGLSLVKFLDGAKKVAENTTESMLVDGSSIRATQVTSDTEAIKTAPNYSTAGMELLTAPQMLVNANINQDTSLRATDVLDKFRPLMSLISLEITVVPTKGIMANKSGTMVLKLHDRSRLSEIAEFIRPDTFHTTELMIEYGWHHPDGGKPTGSDNPYGDLINGMRCKDKFNIVNSSFSFSNNGEVDITVQIMAQGALTFDTQLISSDETNLGNTLKEIEELQNIIAELRNQVFPGGNHVKQTEIRGIQILEAAQDATSNIVLSAELKRAMTSFTNSLGKSKSPKANVLSERLKQLFGEGSKASKGKPTDGLVKKVQNSIVESMKLKITNLEASPDPFLDAGLSVLKIKNNKRGDRRTVDKAGTAKEKKKLREAGLDSIYGLVKNKPYVSLAKIVLFFIGQPLTNSKLYDEVQIIFYPFNDSAGKACNLNIGKFVVDMTYFTDQLYRYRMEHIAKSGNMNLTQFLSFITDIILDDPAAACYGLYADDGTPFYENVVKDGEIRTQQIYDEPTQQAKINEVLKDTPTGSWTLPQVKFFIESVTEDLGSEDGQSLESTNGKTIVRVHVFDQAASNYSSLNSLLKSSRDNEITKITDAGNKIEEPAVGTKGVDIARKQAASAVIDSAEKANILEKINPNNSDSGYVLKGNSRQLKTFIQRCMPYIIYGTAGSTITSAKLTSQQNPRLNTVMTLRAWSKGTFKPNGEDPGNLPMRIVPTQLEISMLGCPLLQFAQSFFVDFQTGTTADNIYNISGITHNFSPGTFSTDIKMAPVDAYGKYTGLLDKVKSSMDIVDEYVKQHPDADSEPSQERGGQ